MKQISLRLDDKLAAAVERARGKQPREAWIRDLLIAAVALPDTPVPFAQIVDARTGESTPVVSGPVTTWKSGEAAPTTTYPNSRVHHPACRCPVCRPPKGGKP